MSDPFADIPRGHFGAILADPPWAFPKWSGLAVPARTKEQPYAYMTMQDIATLPVEEFAADNCVLLCWVTWPMLLDCLNVIKKWGFAYKTCGFAWIKADNTQADFFQEELKTEMKLGYWTRSNSEVCLLATRGTPKRVSAGVRQAIVAPAREHSRKPDGIHERIERLVAGPYLELFARQQRAGWTVWGNQTDKFKPSHDYDANKDFDGSINDCYDAVRERVAAGGPTWEPR
jgi:N6-adenosine-specific RNA methylase IME4